jgi:hypothetical protein
MLFFRSEEALNQWIASKQVKYGEVLSIQKLWDLSRLWYHNRLSPEYHGRTAEQVQKIFIETGLTSEFWQVS